MLIKALLATSKPPIFLPAMQNTGIFVSYRYRSLAAGLTLKATATGSGIARAPVADPMRAH
ncbi:hypothetical protein [Paraburkholderia flagellata]|uniref:hypothetical protein n=1 Tax=Paraburkholderia flagellata TaxID=2883241 RepID=UPI001F2336CF|nr:hypothetical protein [Paraburkholderia flagellata]